MKKFEETVKANPSHHSGRPGATAITCDHRSSVQSAGDSNSCGLSCRLVLDSIREPMCLVNHEGRVIDCNSPACSLLGLKRNHLLSSVLPALAPNAISDKSKNIFVDIIEHLETFQKFFYFNGRKYQSTYIPVATTSDKIDCVSVGCRDVTINREDDRLFINNDDELDPRLKQQTLKLAEANRLLELEIAERLRAENHLKHVNSLYRTVVETSKDVISTMTLDLKYTYVSSSVVNALGYTPE